MIQKRFYTDFEYLDRTSGSIHGDMGYTFNDMPETMTKTLEESISGVKQGIRIDIENGYVTEDAVYIYTVWQYTYDDTLFEDGEEDFSMYSPAITEKTPVYAMCHPCDDDAYAEVCEVYRHRENPGLQVVRYVPEPEQEKSNEVQEIKEAYIVTIECRSRVVVKVPAGTTQEEINRIAIQQAVAKMRLDAPGYIDADNCIEVEPDEECPAEDDE